MTDRLRLGLFGVALSAIFGVGAAIGAIAGPIDIGGPEHHPATTVVAGHEADHTDG